MARSRNPVAVIVTMALLGAVVCAIFRFAFVAYIISQAGESLRAVPLKVLLMGLMELHRFAVYGAGGGAILGVVLVLVDLLRYGGRSADRSWENRQDVNPFARDEVKARRMAAGGRYMQEHPPGHQDNDTS
jgi:hypothetical protein